jgi:NADH-quinone oxidoreductase subunit J
MEAFLFYLFSTLALLSGWKVVQSENPVHSVLFLVLVFFNAAGLLLLLEAEFLAMLFIVVYVGAIAVLFLFVVMMLQVKLARTSLTGYLPVGGLLFLAFFLEVLVLLEGDLLSPLGGASQGPSPDQWVLQVDALTNAQILGQVMYTYYFYFFLAASLILLVAMVGAILLTMQVQYNVKRQQIFQQVSRTFQGATFLADRTKNAHKG